LIVKPQIPAIKKAAVVTAAKGRRSIKELQINVSKECDIPRRFNAGYRKTAGLNDHHDLQRRVGDSMLEPRSGFEPVTPFLLKVG